MNQHMVPVAEDAARETLEAKRAKLAADLNKTLAPGEIAAPYVARVKAGPVPVINARMVRT